MTDAEMKNFFEELLQKERYFDDFEIEIALLAAVIDSVKETYN